MTVNILELIQVVGLIGVTLLFGFIIGISFDFFNDGVIDCYALKNVEEIEDNKFKIIVKCDII